jgi:hypothetical protein
MKSIIREHAQAQYAKKFSGDQSFSKVNNINELIQKAEVQFKKIAVAVWDSGLHRKHWFQITNIGFYHNIIECDVIIHNQPTIYNNDLSIKKGKLMIDRNTGAYKDDRLL